MASPASSIYNDTAAIRAAGHAIVDEAVRYLERTGAEAAPATVAGPPAGASHATVAATEHLAGPPVSLAPASLAPNTEATPRGPLPRPADIARLFEALPPPEGAGLEAVLRRIRDDVVPNSNALADPMYMGHQVCPPLPVAALADAVVSVLNQSQAVWEMSPAGTLLEARLIRWFASLAGYDEGAAGGSFVSGGSAATLTALLAARAHAFPDAWRRGSPHDVAIVTGEQAHYSVSRAAGIMGIGADAVVTVPVNDAGSTDIRALSATLDSLRSQRRRVPAVVATAGSTATGAFDDLHACADLAAQHDAWLHVDAAHGASGLLSDLVRPRLAGIERADSLAWDPHKMMFQPLSTALVLVRDRRALEQAMRQEASYLFQPATGDGSDAADARPADQGAWTLQCSRRSDALRLWLALEYYGVNTIAELFDHCVRLTRRLHELLADADDFEPLHAPQCNMLCFRYTGGEGGGEVGEGEGAKGVTAVTAGGGESAGERAAAGATAKGVAAPDFQDRLRARYNASGQGWITAATVRGQRALRVTLINPRTEEAHLRRMMDGLRREARARR